MSTDNNTTTSVVHTEAVKALIEKVRALRQEIPNFVPPSSSNETRRLVSAASVPAMFVELAASAVENTPVLGLAGGEDPNVVRDLISYGEAYTVLQEEFKSLSKALRNSVATAQNRAGRFALNTYALATRLAQQPENADTLLPIADSLRRALGKSGVGGRKPETKTEAKSQPVSQTAPQPTTNEPTTK